jgi:hypothetical protein
VGSRAQVLDTPRPGIARADPAWLDGAVFVILHGHLLPLIAILHSYKNHEL